MGRIAGIVLLLLPLVACSDAGRVSVLEALPRQDTYFTQGLEYRGESLFESSGRYGRSFVIRHHPDKPPLRRDLPATVFAEGLTLFGDELILLTWRSGRAWVFEADSLRFTRFMQYRGEGWGLTQNGEHLIMSNGSSWLSLRDPRDFTIKRRLQVTRNGKPVDRINELEWHRGLILANRWQTDNLLVIDPRNGEVLDTIDLGFLYPASQRTARADVLNGIAYHAASDSWLVTGKLWPKSYRLRLRLDDLIKHTKGDGIVSD